MQYYELTPAYGADYSKAKDVQDAWAKGADFIGDYSLGFKYVNIEDIPKPCTVNLRYSANRKVVPVEVAA